MIRTLTATEDPAAVVSFDALKHLVVSASRFMPKAEVLELADALHEALRERRGEADCQLSVDAHA